MALEPSVNHITDLVAANPAAGDEVSQGDDHIRNIKTALLTDFANINAAVSATPTQLDYTVVATPGKVEPSKAVVAGAGGAISFEHYDQTNVDINSGKIDGTEVGSTTPSTGDFTTLTASGQATNAADTNMKTATFAAENDEGTDTTIDWTASNKAKVSPTGTFTYTFTPPPNSKPTNLILKVVNGGAATITWPATVLWPSGTDPSLTTSGTDIISFYFDGTNYYGAVGLDFS